ncbi:hypothetical protein AVEN_142012-1 [Araneus ventricosus]|uniref:Uncharacterized protein n=1 Tax=Araneus ventricosus TaxID=182803 RepID=A0A4Y2MB22_ARAVE|nr:hypothetical protein AVEN_142012-1 [Araneus ventricosus]
MHDHGHDPRPPIHPLGLESTRMDGYENAWNLLSSLLKDWNCVFLFFFLNNILSYNRSGPENDFPMGNGPDRGARSPRQCNEIGLKFSLDYYLSTTVEYPVQKFSPTVGPWPIPVPHLASRLVDRDVGC